MKITLTLTAKNAARPDAAARLTGFSVQEIIDSSRAEKLLG
jgi:hypothetical protein